MARKVMLVLGGGGARGLAHLGILRELEKAAIPIDAIVGTSAGAIIGGVYACNPDAEAVERKVLGFLGSAAFRRLNIRFDLDAKGSGNGGARKPSLLERVMHGLKRQLAMELLFRRPAIFKTELLHILVRHLIGEHDFASARIPMFVTALDLRGGCEIVLSQGDLVRAVVASSSVPGFFPPVDIDGRLLADAGLTDNMPVEIARGLGADVVIAVSLNCQIERVEGFATGIEVIFRSEEIGTKMINEAKKKLADVVIEPDTQGRYWLDFTDIDSVVAAGAAAARHALPRIRELLGPQASTVER